MLACVCQPSDIEIFRRSPVPLNASTLQIQGAIPKLGPIIPSSSSSVITSEPNTKINLRRVSRRSSKCSLNISTKNVDDITSETCSGSSLSENLSLNISNESNDKTSNVKLSPTEDDGATSSSKFTSPFRLQVLLTKTDISKTLSTSAINSTTITEVIQLMNFNDVLGNSSEQSENETFDSRNTTKNNEKLRRRTNNSELPEGVQLTLSELREMACRQQAQIDSQHQLLAAKEQRLRYLKDQEARQQRVQAETERLRRLRDRVDAQELKLRKLRALRGQVDHHKQNNISLTSDLESIRALFNEKEKELSLAVAKVEELTRQLEELRRGRSRDQVPLTSALELDKLRRELMYRNKLNEQQNQRLNQQREALTARQEEMSSIDKRISELQERLHRKRLLNQQLATQISAASNKVAYHQLIRLTGSSDQTNQFYGRKPVQQTNNQSYNGLPRGNIATVEPYNHVPIPNGHQIKLHHDGSQESTTYHPVYQQNHHLANTKIDSDQQNAQEEKSMQDNNKISNNFALQTDENDVLKEFSVSKSDPKYQTLPYNTKFTVSLISNKMNNKLGETNDNNVNTSEAKDVELAHHISNNGNANIQSQHMTVHSAPLNVINKNIATPLHQNDLISRKNTDHIAKEQTLNMHNNNNNVNNTNNNITNTNNNNQSHINGDLKQHCGTKHQPNDISTNHLFINNSSPSSYQKPISSVAPTSIHHSGKFSNIYQTSSIKVQPVEPQTVINNHKQLPVVLPITQSPQQLTLSPPQANSTPVGTPETQSDKLRPALPPKPAIKPPPRQTQASLEDDHNIPPPVPLTEPPDDNKTVSENSNHGNIPQLSVYSQSKTSAFNQVLLNQKNITNSQQTGVPISQTQTSNSQLTNVIQSSNINHSVENMPIIKAKPLAIKKQPLSEQPKLRNQSAISKLNGLVSNNRRIEIPSAFNFNEVNATEKLSDVNTVDQETAIQEKDIDEADKCIVIAEDNDIKEIEAFKEDFKHVNDNVVRRCKKGNLKQTGKANLSRRVSFDPLALLLDASLEGELELVKKTAGQVPNPSAANDEGITALHNAICAGHLEIVKFLVEFGCDVNAQDSDGWTPLHCAASCNNVAMVKFLVEHGACIFATTLSDHETAAEKCEEDEEGFDGCSEYLYSVQEKLGILSAGAVYAVFDYIAQQPDELSFNAGQQLTVLRKGDESEREWWWSRLDDKEGYVPRNLLGLYPRVSLHED